MRPFAVGLERHSIQVERSAGSIGRKQERTAVRCPRGRDVAAGRRRSHHRLTARIRIDEHNLVTGRRAHVARPRYDARPETIGATRTQSAFGGRSSAASRMPRGLPRAAPRSITTSVRTPPDRWTAATRLPSGERSTSVSRAPFVRRRTAPVRRSSRYRSLESATLALILELIEVHAHRHSGRPALRHTAWPASVLRLRRARCGRAMETRVRRAWSRRSCRRGRSAVRTPGTRDGSGAPQKTRHRLLACAASLGDRKSREKSRHSRPSEAPYTVRNAVAPKYGRRPAVRRESSASFSSPNRRAR